MSTTFLEDGESLARVLEEELGERVKSRRLSSPEMLAVLAHRLARLHEAGRISSDWLHILIDHDGTTKADEAALSQVLKRGSGKTDMRIAQDLIAGDMLLKRAYQKRVVKAARSGALKPGHLHVIVLAIEQSGMALV